LVGGEPLQDIRSQVFADGMFHILMYAIGCLGLWLLWLGDGAVALPRSSAVLGITLLGFGIWQIVDVALFHWILRIHRIRVDVVSPLFWDIAWLIVFGLPALALAYWLLRSTPGASPPVSPRRALASVTAIMLTTTAISLAPLGGFARRDRQLGCANRLGT